MNGTCPKCSSRCVKYYHIDNSIIPYAYTCYKCTWELIMYELTKSKFLPTSSQECGKPAKRPNRNWYNKISGYDWLKHYKLWLALYALIIFSLGFIIGNLI